VDKPFRNENYYVQLARQALEHYIKTGKVLKPSGILKDHAENKSKGLFVTILKNGQLRGCMGTIRPRWESLEQEIIHNAINAGTRDPRFLPVDEEELADLIYVVDVLKEPEPVFSLDELDVNRYGLIAKCGDRCGALLPGMEGIDTPAKQLEVVLSKAGIHHGEEYTMERFEVTRYGKVGLESHGRSENS